MQFCDCFLDLGSFKRYFIIKDIESFHFQDREHNALWQELTKYQMTCTDDYTGEVLDEQIWKQCDDVETRFASVSSFGDRKLFCYL